MPKGVYKHTYIGEKHGMWKGDKAKYSARHMYMASTYGKAKECELCHTTTKKWFDWANISGEYKREREDWIQVCRPCHRGLDRKKYCKRGHEFTEENTRRLPNGIHTLCLTCLRMRERYHYIKRRDKKRAKKLEILGRQMRNF